MQTAFFEAVVNRRHRVLGRWLHDFCLYDVLFLEIAGNPLWFGGRTPTLDDLREAVRICSLPPERLLRAEFTPRGCREWCAFLLSALRFRRRRDRLRLPAELEKFTAYLADFNALPSLWDARSGGRRLRAPWIHSLALFIEMNTNMTRREIMTAPLGLMHWTAETIAERLGVNLADMMTDEEEAIGAEQRAAMAESGETFPEPDEAEHDQEEAD